MKPQNISAENSPKTIHNAQNADKRQVIILDENNTEYLEKGYIYDTDQITTDIAKANNNPILVNLPYEISSIDQSELGNVTNLKKGNYGVMLFYNGNTAYFLGRAYVNNKWEYCKIMEAIKVPNPHYKEPNNADNETDNNDNKNPKYITLSDDSGKLIGNFVFESTYGDTVLISYSDAENNPQIKVLTNEPAGIDDAKKFGITSKEVYKIKRLPVNPHTCVVKTDVYIVGGSVPDECNDVEFILDGGNLYRHHKLVAVPNRIICKAGAYIDQPSKVQRLFHNSIYGAEATYIKNANEDCSVQLFGGQNNLVMEFNPMDFVRNHDYGTMNSTRSINLNNVLERILKSVYNKNNQLQRITVKMPENHYGHTSFFLERPLVIPHGMTLNMSGSTIYIPYEFSIMDWITPYNSKEQVLQKTVKHFEAKIKEQNTNGIDIYQDSNQGEYTKAVDYIFAFGTNDTYANLATATVKNVEIKFDNTFLESVELPRKVFNLTNFSGVMDNVNIDFNYRNDMIAFWQPYGTPTETYSDRKIIRRCVVHHSGWRNETPTAIFCLGDSAIIEQCILGYVAIIGGNSYTIRGCLNDSYFLFDTSVDFNGSYWEVGQFQILDSKVNFSSCRLDAQNNHFKLNHDSNLRYYIGPWMAIDTEGCRDRLLNLFKKHNLNLDRFNRVAHNQIPEGYKNYRGYVANEPSVVTFDSTIRSSFTFWGWKQPMSGPLFKIGEGAQVNGIENLQNPGDIYIHNFANKETVSTIEVPVEELATVPLNDGKFFDIKKDIQLPTELFFYISNSSDENKTTEEQYKNMGTDWGGEIISDISVRFLLDKERKLYSKEYTCPNIITTEKGNYIYIRICAPNKEYSNLMTELSFKMSNGTESKQYTFRQHLNRIVKGDLLCFSKNDTGDKIIRDNIIPSVSDQITICTICIAKAWFKKEDLYEHSSDGTGIEIEKVECTADLQNPSDYALSDYCGNTYEPLSSGIKFVNTASGIQHIGGTNIRTYMSTKPITGKWTDGDEVVLLDDVLRYYNNKWYNILSPTLRPIS